MRQDSKVLLLVPYLYLIKCLIHCECMIQYFDFFVIYIDSVGHTSEPHELDSELIILLLVSSLYILRHTE